MITTATPPPAEGIAMSCTITTESLPTGSEPGQPLTEVQLLRVELATARQHIECLQAKIAEARLQRDAAEARTAEILAALTTLTAADRG